MAGESVCPAREGLYAELIRSRNGIGYRFSPEG
jgi:hypothetical protein